MQKYIEGQKLLGPGGRWYVKIEMEVNNAK